MGSSISSTHTSTSQLYIEQLQAINAELCNLSDQIYTQLSQPSIEKFAPLYLSYEQAVEKMRALKKIKSLMTEILFKDTMACCELVCGGISDNCNSIFYRIIEIIHTDAVSLPITPPEKLAKKCDEILRRIQTFKTLHENIEENPSIKFALNMIRQTQNPFSSPGQLDQPNPQEHPSIEECIKELPTITDEFIRLCIALNSSENDTKFSYFTPIALAYKNAVERINKYTKKQFDDPEFSKARAACVDAYRSLKEKMDECFKRFIPQINKRADWLATNSTRESECVEVYLALKRDINILLALRPWLADEELSISITILKDFKEKCTIPIPDQSSRSSSISASSSSSTSDSVSSSSSSSSSSSYSSITTTSSSIVQSVWNDLHIPPDNKYDPLPRSKRSAPSVIIHTNQEADNPFQLSITIPENDENITIPVPKLSYYGKPERSVDEDSDYQEDDDLNNPELQQALALSMTTPSSSDSSQS